MRKGRKKMEKFQDVINDVIENGPSVDAIDMIHSAVAPLCETAIDGTRTTTLYDWLWSGSYDGDETPESIAAEWDELSHE